MRLIDADELRKKVYPFPCAIGVEYAVTLRAIDEAPTVDAETVRPGRWIPTAERLPEEGDSVLAIVSGKPKTNVELIGTPVIAEYLGEEVWFIGEWPDWENASPEYWMPLPSIHV